MKKINKFAAATCLLALAWMPGAHAVLINGTDVGSIDTLECAFDSANSGQAYEEAQVLACTGMTVTLVSNIDINSGEYLSDGSTNAIDVGPAAPGVFLLKFGTGNTGNDMFIFTNLADLGYLVWTNALLTSNGLPEGHIQSISHYTFGGGSVDVPEPATLSLFGLGLLGLGGAMRRRKKTTS